MIKSEILDHARMNKPGQGFYKVLAESALRAIKLCQPLRVPSTGYERWKELNPRNLPDNTKPRGPKIVENCGVWRLSGREPKSRLPAGYDPEHKLGKKHYWSNKHRFNDGRHAVQTLVGQMLDWTKSKHKLWHKDLHKKHLMDTQFFEKKKF